MSSNPNLSKAGSRLAQNASHLGDASANTPLTIPFDPDREDFPARHNLPTIEGAPEGAAWVWGKDDQLGRLNLLTPRRTAEAAKELIRTGERVNVNLPLNHPLKPAMNRPPFHHEIKPLSPINTAFDDTYALNTQSGTQWDGFRHVAHVPTRTFYNARKGADFVPAPNSTSSLTQPNSIHHWTSTGGITGRALLLDVHAHLQSHPSLIPDYSPTARFEITLPLLRSVGHAQGIDIRPAAQGGHVRPGDILLIRSGFASAYWGMSDAAKMALGAREHAFGPEDPSRFAGLAQSEEVKDWLHDCWWAAVGGDSPTFEAWPTLSSYLLHEYLLALWGVPIGEMLDLERVAEVCRREGRWSFFLCSVPAHCPGGVGSHVNGVAIF